SFVGMFISFAGVALAPTASAEHRHHPRDRERPVQVDEVFFPVELSDGNTYEIAGYLYHVGTAARPVIQVAVHGATHYHLYWDPPRINGISYSYARYMAQRGYTVLAIDQLGTGASSQPDGDFVNLDETASALHQVLAS